MSPMKRNPSSSMITDRLSLSHQFPSYIYTKRIRLCSQQVHSFTSVHDRIFKTNNTSVNNFEGECQSDPENFTKAFKMQPKDTVDHLRVLGVSQLDQSGKSTCVRRSDSRPGDSLDLPSLETLFGGNLVTRYSPFSRSQMKSLDPTTSESSFLPSSTPFSKEPIGKSNDSESPTERQIYKRLLAEASNSVQPSNHTSTEELTIIIDDVVEHDRTSVLPRCSISPIRANKGNATPIQSTSSKPSDKIVVRTRDLSAATVTTTQPDAADREARAWLKACERTPFLSSDWLKHLTVKFQDKADQRARERQLAEAKLRQCEKQREMSHQVRMANLEQRLACLLLTPPVLVDPYLVPQPIPIELPYKPVAVHRVPPALPELTEAQWAETEAALRSGSADTILVENFNLCVTRRELMTLTGSNWLSDMVINFYMQLLYHRSQNQSKENSKNKLPRIAVLSTFFYAKLTATTGGGYSGVRRWSRQLKLLDQDLVLIPIHDRGMHWCLACIDLRSRTISYYDSMGSGNNKCLRTLKSYLEEECMDKKGHPLPNSDSWQLINTEDSVPQQMNGSDCGVFMCTFGEFLSRNANFSFSQKDMPGIRKRMIYEIINQRLLTTGYEVNKS